MITIKELESYEEKEKRGEVVEDSRSKAVFRLIGPLGKLYNIIIHIRSSLGRIKEFLELIERIVLLDNHIR